MWIYLDMYGLMIVGIIAIALFCALTGKKLW